MPQSIDEFLNSFTTKKNKLQSIDEFLNPPSRPQPDIFNLSDHPELQTYIDNPPSEEQGRTERQAALRAAAGYIPTSSDEVSINLGKHPDLLDAGSIPIDTSKLNPDLSPKSIETPKQNVVSGPVAESILYGLQGLSQPVRTLGELTPSIRSQVSQFSPEQAQFISPGVARGAEIAGVIAGSLPGYEGLTQTLGKATAQGLAKIGAGRVGQFFGREAVVGKGMSTANQIADIMGDTNHDGDQTLTERLKAIIEGGVLNAALGGAFHGAITGAKAGLSPLIAKQAEKQAFRQSIDEFIAKTQQPRGETDFAVPPNERIVQPAGGQKPANGDQFAENFNRGESFQKEFEQAVQDQYDFLKQSMANRGGVDQGALLRDPTTGEVIDRIGRISNNPPWYQEFFEQHGRTPTNKDLRELAEQQVKQGFQDEAGRIPSFKPDEMQRLDSEISDIQSTLPHMEGDVKAGLQQELERLQGERGRMAGVLPEGVQAMHVKGDSTPVEPISRNESTSATASPPDQSSPSVDLDALPDAPRRGTTNTVKPISRAEVITNLKNNLKVVIDTGRLGTSRKTVLGIFKRKSEVVRSRAMHDVATIAHEVGHALEKRFKLVDPQFQDEFMGILHKHSNIDMGAYKPSELQEEGFAEYMRLLLTDPKLAFEAAPKFSQHLLNKLPPNVVKALRASQSDIARWLQQDGLHSAMGKIDFVHGKAAKKFNFQRFYTKTFDDLNPMKLAMNAIYGKRSHLTKTAEENLYKLARNSRGTAERAKLAISDGIYAENGRKLADGLGMIVKDLENIGVTEKELSTYLAVFHAQDLKQLGKEIPFTDAEIQAVLSELDSKAMRNIQQKIVKFNNALLDLLTESGVLSENAVKDMRKKYPNYVPFMRFFDDDLQDGFQFGGFGSGKGFANLTNPIKRMTEEGSERTLIDPMESMVKNTFAVMNAAAKNRVGLSLLDLANTEGAGSLLEIVPGARSAREHVITVKLNGENVAVKVRDPDLYDAILSLDKETANTLIRFLGAATNVLRGGATLTPEFMVRNAIRDVFGAMVNVGFNPINFLKGFGYAISPGLRRMGFKNIENRVYEQFVTSGGSMSTLWGSSRDYTREAMKEAFKKGIKQKALNVVRNPKQLLKVWRPAVWLLKGLRTGAEISELSTKLGKFKSDLNKGASPLEAAFQARDLMDFNRAGSTIRAANQLIAFLNANLQGSDKMVREFSKDPVKFMLRGILTLTLPTVALHSWYSMMPEEQKKALLNIPNYQRDLFFLIPGPNNTFIRIPKPFEAGLLFSSSIDRVLRDMMEHEPDAYNGYLTSVATSFTPPVMIQFFNPYLESLANYSFFRAAPIVPESLQGEQKKFQYDVYTSETAKLAGELLSHTPAKNTPFASPKIIDNLIYGYTAGLGRYGTAGLDAGINLAKGGEDNPKPARNLEQNPFAAPFMANAQGSGELRNQFYDKYNALSEARKSAQTHKEIKFDAGEYGRFHQAYNTMSKLNQDYKRILNDPKLTAEQKRDKLNVIDTQRNDLAYKTLYAK